MGSYRPKEAVCMLRTLNVRVHRAVSDIDGETGKANQLTPITA
jgi:hypothetical protein